MKLEKRLKVLKGIKHRVKVWRDSNIEDLTVSMSFDLLN
jgi:hypothetical protein